MKILSFVLFLIVLSSCQNNSSGSKGYNESRELIPNPEGYKKDTFTQSTADSSQAMLPGTKKSKYYPFELMETDGKFVIAADIEAKELYPKYYDFFKKYGYEGNGPCWEGMIKQILQQQDRSLLSRLSFDSEAGGFYAYAASKEDQLKFADLLSPIFSDLNTLAVWVRKADRSKIDD